MTWFDIPPEPPIGDLSGLSLWVIMGVGAAIVAVALVLVWLVVRSKRA